MENVYYYLGFGLFWLISGLIAVIVAISVAAVAWRIYKKITTTNVWHYHITRGIVPTEDIRTMYATAGYMEYKSNRKYAPLYRLRNIKLCGKRK